MKEVKAKAEEKKCPLQRAIVFIEMFLSEPMCGECFPCSLGSHELGIRLQKIAEGVGTQSDFDAIDRITGHMLEMSRCRKGMDAARFVRDTIKEDSFKGHLEGVCSEKECLSLIAYRVIPQKCIVCGICQDICKDNAIIGERKNRFLPSYLPFEIVQKRCIRCGDCIKVCPSGAIEALETKGLGYLPGYPLFEIIQKTFIEIVKERCTRCDECIKVCPSGAIEVGGLGYQPFEIVEKRCTRCGECIKMCPVGAIAVVDKKEQVVVGS